MISDQLMNSVSVMPSRGRSTTNEKKQSGTLFSVCSCHELVLAGFL